MRRDEGRRDILSQEGSGSEETTEEGVKRGGDGSGWVRGTGDEGCRSSLWPEDEVVGWRDGAGSCAEPWRRRWDRHQSHSELTGLLVKGS
jgi:hypothetical protein